MPCTMASFPVQSRLDFGSKNDLVEHLRREKSVSGNIAVQNCAFCKTLTVSRGAGALSNKNYANECCGSSVAYTVHDLERRSCTATNFCLIQVSNPEREMDSGPRDGQGSVLRNPFWRSSNITNDSSFTLAPLTGVVIDPPADGKTADKDNDG